jgi:hypothetical protein
VRLLRLCLPVFFLVLGIGILAGWIFPGLPSGTGMRPMLGVVTVLFGLYRGAVFLLAPPPPRRPYGGFRDRFLSKGSEKKTPNGDNESKSV